MKNYPTWIELNMSLEKVSEHTGRRNIVKPVIHLWVLGLAVSQIDGSNFKLLSPEYFSHDERCAIP